MATVRHFLDPEGAQFLGSAFPALRKTNGSNYPVAGLAFDAGATDEAAFWKFIAESYGSGNLTVDIFWYADAASSGTVVWEAQIACITPDTDTQDIETDSRATLNYVQDTHLGTTGQRLHKASITLSNLDSIASGDFCTLRVARDSNDTNASDSMSGEAIVVMVEVSYSDA